MRIYHKDGGAARSIMALNETKSPNFSFSPQVLVRETLRVSHMLYRDDSIESVICGSSCRGDNVKHKHVKAIVAMHYRNTSKSLVTVVMKHKESKVFVIR